MPRTAVASARVELVEAPLRRPFITAQGRRERTVNAAITLRLRGGAVGYGEASTSIARKRLTPAALLGALQKMALRARGRDVRGWRALVDDAWTRHGALSPAVAAFEAALLSALAAEAGTGLASWLGGALERVETDLTISASDDEESTRAAAAEAAAAGFRVLKIKVGGRLAEDMARVGAVRRAAPDARLLLDGNQGFSPASALRFLEAALKTGAPVDLFEQPTPKCDLAGLAFVAKRSPVPVAADESAASPSDAARALEAGVSALNVKLAKSGITRGLEIAALAKAAGTPLMIGCMAETARGLAASVHLALGAGCFKWCDLDSDLLLAEDARARRLAGWTRRGRFASLA
ncbi:MAG: dipeptide epimerase [Elusimicrobia bacterium]|nr:dipeptide epimerase [Elusimicrobiota bacterium]